jgi:hypothetical protein
MPGIADFHHHLANSRFPYPDGLFAHAAAFDAAVDLCDAHPSPSTLPMPRFLGSRQLVAAGLLCRVHDGDTVQRERLTAQVLQPLAPCRQWRRRSVDDAFVMDAARMRVTQEEDAPRRVDQQQVFQPVPLFLAAVARFRFSRVLGARDGSRGTVMTNRGATGAGAACPSAAGEASTGRDGPASPSWSRQASTGRQGASPKVRRAVRHTGSKT